MKNQSIKVIHSPKNHQCPSRRGDPQLWSTGILSPKKVNKWKKEYLKKIIQARPPALVYWNSEPKLKFKEQRLIVTTGLTFLTVSKVRQEQLVDSLDQITMLTI